MALKHLLSTELALIYLRNFSKRNNNGRLLREAPESQVVLVYKESVPIEDQVPLHQVMVLVDEFADGAVEDDAVVISLLSSSECLPAFLCIGYLII